ncbi:MAG TPA: hypothetical protein VF804_10635, partial [Holophagaceae bacterium]
SLSLVLLGLPLALALGCSSGGDSNAPVPVTSSTPSANTVLFDPANSVVPLPNILATATAADPLAGRAPNTPMTPPEALAYVNLHEMGGTNAVAGVNAPIYIRFAGPIDPATVGNVKVYQITPDSTGTENNPLGFTDVTSMFAYQYATGGTDFFLVPGTPLQPGTRYVYMVTTGVKDAATGGAISATPYFEALKSTVPLTGALQPLEAIRANRLLNPAQPQSATNPILLSGYAKVMDDMIAAGVITSRANLAIIGRFITTGAGFISATTTSPSATGAVPMPVESALRSFAAGATLGGLPGKAWTNTITVPANTATAAYTFDRGGTNPSPDAYWAAVLTAAGQTVTPAPATVGTVVLGTLNSADLSMDPVVVAAHSASLDLTGITGAYNPAAGVVQAYRPDGLHLTGFYSTSRAVPFVYIAPAGTPPSGGWPLVIFQHGITAQKENVLGVAQTLTTVGRAVVAIDLPMHGALAVPGHTAGAQWGQDFMAIGAPLATRSNIQQAAFNLDRLEFTVRTGGFAGLGAAMPSMTDIKFVGHSLGSIVGAYYLAGNTTLATSGVPYTQTTLNSDMKGYLAVPGGRLAYLIQNSPTFGPSVDAGLAAVGIAKGTPTYNQFFQVTQSVVDPADPASVTTPLAAGLPSRLSNRICIQESVGDTVIGNAYTRYLGNALGGRGVFGAAGATVAPGFNQLAYTAGGTPNHAAGVPSVFMYTMASNVLTPKVANAATVATATTPTEGYFQFDQTGISHSSLLDPSNMTNLLLIQKQMRYFLGVTGTSIVVDPTQGGATLPIAPVPVQDIQVPGKYTILGH